MVAPDHVVYVVAQRHEGRQVDQAVKHSAVHESGVSYLTAWMTNSSPLAHVPSISASLSIKLCPAEDREVAAVTAKHPVVTALSVESVVASLSKHPVVCVAAEYLVSPARAL